MGSPWCHLRICLACGQVGCCDSSPNRHACAHARESGHVLLRSIQPGESWAWCFADQVMLPTVPVHGSRGSRRRRSVPEHRGTFPRWPLQAVPPTAPDTIVLIHGLWMTPRSWEHWKERYEGQGYKVLAPAWPGLEVEVEALRADPTPLTKLTGKQVIDNYERIIRELDSPPVIMGHSLGGAVTQVLLDRGLGAAAVGVAPATVKGIRDLPLSTLRATGHILGRPFNGGNATPSNRKQFRYAFGNTMTQEESDAIYDRYYIPSANRVLYDIALSNLSRNAPTEVDFTRRTGRRS